MSEKDSPYEALDKLLLSPTKAEKKANEKVRQKQPKTKTTLTAKKRKIPNAPKTDKKVETETQPHQEISTLRHHDTTIPSRQDDVIEKVRKAVKQLGKEAATYRFTQDEKKALADIVYTYKSEGVRTSENEITRISINYLLEDYLENDKASIVARVLDRLNA